MDEPLRLPDLSGWMADHGPKDLLTLSHAEVSAIQSELQRLKQSADRLRKQNAKVRKKVDRLRPSPD